MKTAWLGLSITSSWGNGHATNYRGLLAALARRGHEVLFLERDMPGYASNRDFSAPFVRLYRSVDELERWGDDVRDADLVVVGSYVPDGCEVADRVLATAEGVTAFWDIDTPVTAAKLARGDHEYLSPDLVPRFDLYLSFTGGPFLETLGARRPTPFFCVTDPALYRPLDEDDRSSAWAPRQLAFTSETFLLSYSLPNFHFHAVTAYDILRSRGVPLGKRDYEGQLRTRSTSPKSDSATHG